jgi:undecaprenyl diphosphate synthase
MELFMQSLKKYTGEMHEQGIRIRFIGNRTLFSDNLQQQIDETETKTFNNSTMTLNIAANYGGHWDIVNAARVLAQQVEDGELEAANIDEQTFKRVLALGDSPDPDLFIRTGGEQRISNFLLWQLAYTEFYFSDRLWPDFADADVRAALDEYARRQRRYGKTSEQIEVSG